MGIRFVDVVKGNSTPRDGEQVYITAKFMHNGLKLKLNEKIEGEDDGRIIEHNTDRARFARAMREQYRLPEELSDVYSLVVTMVCVWTGGD